MMGIVARAPRTVAPVSISTTSRNMRGRRRRRRHARQFSAAAISSSAPGDIVNALVLQLRADGKVRIAIANKTMDGVSQVPLDPGTTVQLAVKSTATGLALSLVDQGTEHGTASAGTAVLGSAIARPANL